MQLQGQGAVVEGEVGDLPVEVLMDRPPRHFARVDELAGEAVETHRFVKETRRSAAEWVIELLSSTKVVLTDRGTYRC